MSERILFYCIAVITILSAVGVVSARNIFHAGLLLGSTLFSIAGLYLILGTEFLAAVQVLLYVGGILTLILFAIMLTVKLSDKSIKQTSEQKGISICISIVIFGILCGCILKTEMANISKSGIMTTPSDIGKHLFVYEVLPFELLSILLLVALIGAIILARKEEGEK
ncbi:MAG: NADH-quinone oxidoreductase subunit J [Candidatus Stahlbacteria bacterium]|nr:NADH-quinone oxidoreductase subunit J [Candidatus Stahlbacteria bacterium]